MPRCGARVTRNRSRPEKDASKWTPETLQQKFLSGSTPIPNWWFDELMPEGPPDSVVRVFFYLYRKTVGWNLRKDRQSLQLIMSRNHIASRSAAVHAVRILCECWRFWKKTRGQEGQYSSEFEIDCICDHDQAWARLVLTDCIYGSYFPTRQQLKQKPPTDTLYLNALTAGIKEYGRDWHVAVAAEKSQWFAEVTSRGHLK